MKKIRIKSSLIAVVSVLTLTYTLVACKDEATTPQEVTVFEDSNFTGVSSKFGIGEYFANKNQLTPVGNDKITSLQIPSTLKCTICEHDNDDVTLKFGTCHTITADNADLSNLNFNDKTSYIKVEKR